MINSLSSLLFYTDLDGEKKREDSVANRMNNKHDRVGWGRWWVGGRGVETQRSILNPFRAAALTG